MCTVANGKLREILRSDTFDGGFDTEEKSDLTAFTLGNFHAWNFDECDCLYPVQWSRLAAVAS